MRYVPCPKCGYDLRAMVGGRCPECGAEVHGGVEHSVIPWVKRAFGSRAGAFVRTVGLVLFRPGTLAKELRVPARMSDGRRFFMVAMVVGTVLAAVVGQVGLWLHPQGSYVAATFLVCMDRWFGVVALGISVYGAMRACAWMYRGILRLGGGMRYERRRMEALSLYASGALVMVEAVLLALLGLSYRLMAFHWMTFIARWSWLLLLATFAAMVALYLYGSLSLILRSGRLRGLRAFVAACVFPPVALLTILAIVLWVNWVAGYIVLALESMGGK
jgi:hypothetical protein